jgi:hypothetical protein
MRRTMIVCVLLSCACAASGADVTDDEPSADVPDSGGSGGETGSSRATGGTRATGGSAGAAKGSGGATNGGGGAGGSGGAGATKGSGGATSGSGGAAADARPPVGSCTGLGAVGAWENITPPSIQIPPPACGSQPCNYGTQAILVNPLDTTNIYVGGDHKGFFKSTDCGATWVKINTGRNGSVLDTGAAWSAQIDPVDPQVIYAVNGYGSENGLWKTTNGGVDWDNTTPPGSEVATVANYAFASIVSLDPTDHTHVVLSFHSGCSGAYAPNCLAESSDSGASWRLVKYQGAGGEGAGVMVLDRTTWLYGVPSAALWLTQDSGATWTKVASDGGWSHYRSSNGTHYIGAHGVLRSTDGKSWTQIPNSPTIVGVVGDGRTLFGGVQFCGGIACYYTAPESDPTKWTALATPVTHQGGYLLNYDPDHHILYSTNQTAGLWRVVTY